jgi:hypothetical protein
MVSVLPEGQDFYTVTSCHWASSFRCFAGLCCLYFPGSNSLGADDAPSKRQNYPAAQCDIPEGLNPWYCAVRTSTLLIGSHK